MADGNYTPGGETVKSVKRLQRRAGLRRPEDVDGNLGPKTRRRCKKRGIYDFDAVPLEAMGQDAVTHWIDDPDSSEVKVWPPASNEFKFASGEPMALQRGDISIS